MVLLKEERVLYDKEYGFGCFATYTGGNKDNNMADSLKAAMEDYIIDFDKIIQIVNDNYCHFENKNIDPIELSNKYKLLVTTCKNNTEYTKTLLEYFSELKNDHSRIQSQYYGVNFNFLLKIVEGKIFVDKINKADCLIEEKSQIIEIDHIPALEWIKNNKKYISASTENSQIVRTVQSILVTMFPIKRTLLIKRSNDIKEVTVNLKELDNSIFIEDKRVFSNVINERVGYITLNSMMGELSEFVSEYSTVKDLPYLIVDVRKNGGGHSGLSEKISSYLIKKPQKASVSGLIMMPQISPKGFPMEGIGIS
jgi:carboxyl-terminal processing protease